VGLGWNEDDTLSPSISPSISVSRSSTESSFQREEVVVVDCEMKM
jgi:hypothetical protein